MRAEGFDHVVAVDFSAAATANRGPNSLWVAWTAEQGPIRTANPRTRAELGDQLQRLFERATRTLVVVDVALGWPRGMASALGLASHRVAVVQLLDELVSDGPRNANNRFEVANELNRRAGAALFWGHPPGRSYPHLSATTTAVRHLAPRPFDARRLIEHSVGGVIKSPMQLSGAGAVGSQSIMAQVFFERLRTGGVNLSVWPFERPTTPVVVSEQFFSLSRWRDERGTCVDQRQVRAVAREVRSMMRSPSVIMDDSLWEGLPARSRSAVRREEGWLLGWRATTDKVR